MIAIIRKLSSWPRSLLLAAPVSVPVVLLLQPIHALAAPPPQCEVKSLAPIVPASAGFSVSPVDESIVVFAKPVGKTTQLFRVDRRTKQETCITCRQVPGGPAVDRHKGAPAFLADGRRLVLQVEMAQHPFEGAIGGPGAGWFNDVWMTTLEGDRWWNLTRYPSGAADRYGVLLPEPSPDGRRIAWAELYADDGARAREALKRGEPTTGSAPWGHWRIKIADLAAGPEGGISLGPARTITLPQGTWYETQGWSRDGQFLIFASDAGLPTPQAMDLWIHNVTSGRSANLTKTSNAWEEFGDIAPSGKLVAFMSSTCCAFKPTDDKSKLRAELYLTTPDRGFTERLTFFNDPGHAHAKDGPGGSTVTKLRWSKDGTKIHFERPFYGSAGAVRGSYLMELTFAGACGAVDPSASPGGRPAEPSQRPASKRSELPGMMRLGGAPIEIIANAGISVAGQLRSYRAAVPKANRPPTGSPVVVAFHGFGDTKDLMPLYSGLDDLARQYGAIVVYPQSRPGAWPLVLDWARPDFAFFDALLEDLDRKHRIDRSRIFVTGMSNGAYFANLLASQRASVVAAIAPHSGGLGALALGTVPATRRFPVMIIHGGADRLVKIDEARKQKAYYEGRRHEVRYVEIPGLGHSWARGQGINAQIWSFFASHPLR